MHIDMPQTQVLSTGEVRKVMFARALAQRPRLLVLDKVYDGLDAPSRERCVRLFVQLCASEYVCVENGYLR